MAPLPRQHFLLATFPAQGHINPALHLANRLARINANGALVTFSTAISGHRLMFPTDDPTDDGFISYIPFSDGYDRTLDESTGDVNNFMSTVKSHGRRSLPAICRTLAARGRPVTCIIYTLLVPWAAEVAREMAIPSALYWIQPATVFAIYHHYFHGYDDLVSAHREDPLFAVSLPRLPAMQIRDLPSFFTMSDPNNPYFALFAIFKEVFDNLDKESGKPRVLMNTCEALEVDAIAAVDAVDMIPIGPLLPSTLIGDEEEGRNDVRFCGDLFKPADEKAYMEWLQSKAEGSVVYVSFGSLSVLSKRQVEEISRGLEASGRPYLWVLRKDSRFEEVLVGERGEMGMVVEWCSQLKVLSHPSVGCFVTHCGWNSTFESLACGVPMVCVPQWTDQGTNARLVETAWGAGVRGEVDGEGVLEGKELQRCLEVAMGEWERGTEIRKATATWRHKLVEAARGGGSSNRNLMAFVKRVTQA